MLPKFIHPNLLIIMSEMKKKREIPTFEVGDTVYYFDPFSDEDDDPILGRVVYVDYPKYVVRYDCILPIRFDEHTGPTPAFRELSLTQLEQLYPDFSSEPELLVEYWLFDPSHDDYWIWEDENDCS